MSIQRIISDDACNQEALTESTRIDEANLFALLMLISLSRSLSGMTGGSVELLCISRGAETCGRLLVTAAGCWPCHWKFIRVYLVFYPGPL